MALLPGLVRAILSQEAFPIRFEKFAADIVSKIEGDARIVTTSSNYDQGRDGVSVGGGPRIVVCCSLTDQIDNKALADARKLAKTSKNLERVYFCSTKQFTERAGDLLAATFGAEAKCPGKVQALSQDKLVQFGSTYDDIVRKHYPAEVHQAVAALAEGPDAVEQEHALRLALTIAGTDDAAAIREGVWGAALRQALADGAQRTPAELAVLLSNTLRLAAALRPDVVRAHLGLLVDEDLVGRTGDLFQLTEAGNKAVAADAERSAKAIFEGRDAFKDAVETALHQKLTNDQVSAMWGAMQDKLATLLYERGREILALLAPLLTLATEVPAAPSSEALVNSSRAEGDLPKRVHKDIVEPLANAAGSAFLLPAQAEEVRAAVRDLLHGGSGPAVDWLTRACYAFVCACSLGLEVRTQMALAAVVSRTTLVLDTDVVLSYLSPDETAHEAAQSVVKQWRELGGRVIVSQEVLAEVAYHAWISHGDFMHVKDLLPGTAVDRQILSRNAFVRGFGALLERRQAKMSQWDRWIGQFKGRSRTDQSALRETLLKEHHLGELPPPTKPYRKLAGQIKDYIAQGQVAREGDGAWNDWDAFVRADKGQRDSSLFASIAQAIDEAREKGDGEAVYLVTSSARLRGVQRRFRPDDAGMVLTIPAVTYVLSMVPGRTLGLTALRSFVFDGQWQERVTDFELLALRIIKRSDEFDLPWAKRGPLLKNLRSRVESVARERSGRRRAPREDIAAVQSQWSRKDGSGGELEKALAQALDEVAADRRSEAEIAQLKGRVKELQAQLEKERSRKRG